MLLPPTRGRFSASRRSAPGRGDQLVEQLRLSGRVIRPKSLEELFNLMSEDELMTLMYELKEKKKWADSLQGQDGSKEEHFSPEAAEKLTETIVKVEQHLGIPTDSKGLDFDGLQEKAAKEMRRLGHTRDVGGHEFRIHCFIHVWAMIHDLRTKFAQQKDLPDFLVASLPEINRKLKRHWDGLKAELFKIYIKSKDNDCNLLPRVIVAVPDFHFLRSRIHDMARANSLLDMSDDLGDHLNGCFIAINDPHKASKAQLELLQESIRNMSARKAMQVVRAEQLMDRKEQEGSLKRLRTGLAKHQEASIVCKDTEESLCAMLRAAYHLRQGNRLSSSSSELIVVPIMRPSEGSGFEGSTSGASTSKQAANHQRLSAVIPEGYSYRFVLLTYSLGPVKQGLEIIRTHLELTWQEGPEDMDIAAYKEESNEKKRKWQEKMKPEVEKKMENVVPFMAIGHQHLPYIHLIGLMENVEKLRRTARDACPVTSRQDQRALGLRMREEEKRGAEASSSPFMSALKVDEAESVCRALKFLHQDDSWNLQRELSGSGHTFNFQR